MEFNAWIMDISQFLTRYSAMFFGGLRNTLILSAIAGVLSVLVGGGLCVLRMSRLAPLRWIANVWIEFVRGTPVLVQIMMVYYGLPLLGVNLPAPSFLGTAGSRSMYGILALTINSGGYICEIIRSGIQSVDPGQMEAARCVGMNYRQAMVNVILPQAIRNILPALCNEFVTIIKETSVLSMVGIAEIMFQANAVSAASYIFVEPYIIAALMYFTVVFPLSKLVAAFERRMSRSVTR